MEYEQYKVNFKVLKLICAQWSWKACNFFESSVFVEFKITSSHLCKLFLALGLMAITSETLKLTHKKFGMEIDHKHT